MQFSKIPRPAPATPSATFDGGHLREAMLYLTDVMRGLGFTNTSSRLAITVRSATTGILSARNRTCQEASSISFRRLCHSGHRRPTRLSSAMENTASAILRLTWPIALVYNKITGFTVDLARPARYGMTRHKLAFHGRNLVGLAGHDVSCTAKCRRDADRHSEPDRHDDGMAERARVATYLVITASQYKIEH